MKPLACAALLLCTAYGPADAQPKDFGNAVKIATVEEIKLSNQQRRSYRSYRSNRAYFGAFYVALGTDHTFWTRNFHNFDVAKAAAKKGCEIVSDGGDCRLYAVLYPAGVDPNERGVKGMGLAAAKALRGRFKRDQKKDGYGAFALNKAYGFGYSYNADSLEEAHAAALAYCKTSSAKALAPLGIEGRNWANARGLGRCEVIGVHKP